METKTKVIFRKWPNGDVIALFPEVPSDCQSYYHCLSYEIVGEHGGADGEGLIARTTRATAAEAADTALALKRRGYKLEIRQRITPQMRTAREREWQRIRTL